MSTLGGVLLGWAAYCYAGWHAMSVAPSGWLSFLCAALPVLACVLAGVVKPEPILALGAQIGADFRRGVEASRPKARR